MMTGKQKKRTEKQSFSAPDLLTGLTAEDVRLRTEAGLSNRSAVPKTKSIPRILREHTMTLFNLLNIIMAIAVISVGSPKNALFLGVVFSNVFVGVFQEIRAKTATDKLALLTASTVTVRRDGTESRIASDKLVYGDIVLLHPGDQIPAGCQLIYGECEVSEALLTGESEPIVKVVGDSLLSGSFVASGECVALAVEVGADGMLQEIAAGAKQYRKKNSVIIAALRRIIHVITVLMIPFSAVFLWLQRSRALDTAAAIRNTVAAMVGMIPEGLILLVSSVMALAVYRLSKKRILVKELYSVEALARTDTLCLDKTGTLTDGRLTVAGLLPFTEQEDALEDALSVLAANTSGNETIEAIRRYCRTVSEVVAAKIVPFSSKKKFCMVYSDTGAAYILGAPDYVLTPEETEQRTAAETLAAECRVLCVSVAQGCNPTADTLPENRKAVGLVMLADTIRPGAVETVAWFVQQNVQIKLISGDHPVTVARIARAAGVPQFDQYFDLSGCPENADYRALAETYTVFGRATPVQKQLLIRAMRENGHTVAMTGDGVNDVLALREADCALAINDGTDAARNVSDIVMLDSDYNALPDVVLQGRSAVNNLERSASLFLIKTIYSVLLGLLFIFLSSPYPFIPIQLTLTSSLTVAIPSLLLSLQSSTRRIEGNFLSNALQRALPTGIAITASVIFASVVGASYPIPQTDISTICALCTAICAFCGLTLITAPFNRPKAIMLSALAGTYFVAVLLSGNLFEMSLTRFSSCLIGIGALLTALVASLAVRLAQSGFARLHLEKYVIRLISIIRYFSRKMSAHHVGASAAQTAFFMLFASVPLLILLLSATTLLSLSAEEFIGSLSGMFPSLVGGMFDDIVRNVFENGSSVMTSFSAFAVMWSASKGVYYMTSGLNAVYEVKESRNVFKLRFMSVIYTLSLIVIIIAALLLMVFGSFITGFIQARAPELGASMNALSSLRFVIGLLLLTFLFALLFKVLPDRKCSFASQLPGAVFSAVGWVLFSFFFSFYVNNFANYANIYGSLAAIVVFMLWLYVCMYILFFGAEVNLLIRKSSME